MYSKKINKTKQKTKKKKASLSLLQPSPLSLQFLNIIWSLIYKTIPILIKNISKEEEKIESTD